MNSFNLSLLPDFPIRTGIIFYFVYLHGWLPFISWVILDAFLSADVKCYFTSLAAKDPLCITSLKAKLVLCSIGCQLHSYFSYKALEAVIIKLRVHSTFSTVFRVDNVKTMRIYFTSWCVVQRLRFLGTKKMLGKLLST